VVKFVIFLFFAYTVDHHGIKDEGTNEFSSK